MLIQLLNLQKERVQAFELDMLKLCLLNILPKEIETKRMGNFL